MVLFHPPPQPPFDSVPRLNCPCGSPLTVFFLDTSPFLRLLRKQQSLNSFMTFAKRKIASLFGCSVGSKRFRAGCLNHSPLTAIILRRLHKRCACRRRCAQFCCVAGSPSHARPFTLFFAFATTPVYCVDVPLLRGNTGRVRPLLKGMLNATWSLTSTPHSHLPDKKSNAMFSACTISGFFPLSRGRRVGAHPSRGSANHRVEKFYVFYDTIITCKDKSFTSAIIRIPSPPSDAILLDDTIVNLNGTVFVQTGGTRSVIDTERFTVIPGEVPSTASFFTSHIEALGSVCGEAYMLEDRSIVFPVAISVYVQNEMKAFQIMYVLQAFGCYLCSFFPVFTVGVCTQVTVRVGETPLSLR